MKLPEDTANKFKTILREADVPFFSDEELEFYYAQNNGDIKATLYQLLNIKAEDTTVSLTGFSTADTSKYYRRLAAAYRPLNSGVLRN